MVLFAKKRGLCLKLMGVLRELKEMVTRRQE